MLASPRLGLVNFMVTSVIVDRQSALKGKCIDSDVRGDKYLEAIMDGIPVKVQRKKKE